MRPDGYALPEPLADRFPEGAVPIGQGAEADVYRVSERDGTPRAVKLYRPGVHADRTVWRKLGLLQHPAIVRMVWRGITADGRDFEVLEHLGGGSLQDRLGVALGEKQVTSLVRRLVGGLICLHEADIVHRDLKPSNLLHRNRKPDSGIVIADFGISRERGEAPRTTSMTLAYAPPEYVLNQRFSPAYDWWSLGMIVRQSATGTPPYAGLDERGIRERLADGGISLENVPGQRLPVLCAGLLRPEPEDRWAGRQVLEWLDGHDVAERVERPEPRPGAPTTRRDPPSSRPAPGRPSRGLAYAGELHTTRRSLAAAIRRRPDADHHFFGTMGSPEAPSEVWRELLGWLREFDELTVAEREQRTQLIDRWLTRDLPTPLKLLRLLLWLDPSGAPSYQGQDLDLDQLATTCWRACRKGDSADADLVAALSGGMLDTLGEFPALRDLRGVGLRWEQAALQWEAASASTMPKPLRSAAEPGLRALLLLSVLPGGAAGERLRELGAGLPDPGQDPYWYRQLYGRCYAVSASLGDVVRAYWGRTAAEQQEQRRVAAERLAERLEAERLEAESKEAELREAERLGAERRARLAAERAKREREATERQAREAGLAAEYYPVLDAWEESERRRLSSTARWLTARQSFAWYVILVALAVLASRVPWEVTGHERVALWLAWETGVIALPGLWVVMRTAYRLGDAYSPAAWLLLYGREGRASWWEGGYRGSASRFGVGLVSMAVYVWQAGMIWESCHAALERDSYVVSLVHFAFAGMIGVLSMVLLLVLMKHGKPPKSVWYTRREAAFEEEKQAVRDRWPGVEVRPRDGTRWP
ncbi:protein kinase domain-containing protein [Streptomyces scabiei]|uniref:Serine/threonine-protein kinase PknL n=1 Tax=Streptomyces scabiei TaxID=1930 RepID=A0A100JK63_STRSC|nr:protein kinase [Streptomyces scabiei]GAQ61036.1 serine/threonine-protein kinase PknL [Streptomyces scabiei]